VTYPIRTSAERALRASDAEHVAAIAAMPCPICGVSASAECRYGVALAAPGGQFPGRAHTRRVRLYLDKVRP
jgi:hypothetical protein